MKRKVVGCYFFWFLVILCLIVGRGGSSYSEVNLKKSGSFKENIALGEIAEISYPNRVAEALREFRSGVFASRRRTRNKPEEIYGG